MVEATTEVAVSVAAEEGGAPATVTAPATSEEARPVAAEAPAQVEVAMEEPQAVPVGSEGGAPIAAIAPAKPAVEEAEVPVVQSVVATEAPALVAAPPSAAAPPPGAERGGQRSESQVREERQMPRSRKARMEGGGLGDRVGSDEAEQ